MAELLQETPVAAETPQGPEVKKKKGMSKKTRRRIIRWAIILLVLAGLAAAAWHFFGGKKEEDKEIMTDFVQIGSISSTVTGSGLAKAASSETITLTTAGTVMDVFVTEGQLVEEGDPLFLIDSPAADTSVQNARTNVDGIRKQLSTARKNLAGLNLAAPYAGKLLDTADLHAGEDIGTGVKIATLADDTRMRLTQYYSYAYADSIKEGQSVEVSIPALMTSVTGTVETVHMVSRITPEGSKLFSAEIVVPNAGVLAADMTASATASVNGEMVYPYEAGKLEYYRVSDLTTT
ncbi:MAG: HlyD family efflux transporter periplasmic adaptor subunit, partial [Oscillibacter sp.]|nr:HlyD family efflux transporter periplasmic adaptor subunit [Oscillibacter sp.]